MDELQENRIVSSLNSLVTASLDSIPKAASAAVFLTGAAVLLGWLVRFPGARLIHPALGPMNSHTAFCFMAAGGALWLSRVENAAVPKLFGVLVSRPRARFMALALSSDAGGVTVRRLLPAAIAIPVLTGWLVIAGQRAGFYSRDLSLAFYTMTVIVVFGSIVWFTGISPPGGGTADPRAQHRTRA